jgi:glycerol transport system permease protein
MDRWPNHRAALLLLPALAVLALVGGLPLLAVINYGLHDIFTLHQISWVGLQWYQDILTSERFWASLGRSLLFSALALLMQVPLGIAVAKLLLPLGRGAVWGLVLCALPLVVPWNIIAMLWLGLIDPQVGALGGLVRAIGFDYKFNALHSWALILMVDTWHWLGLVVVLSYAGLAAVPQAYRRAAVIDGASRWALFWHVELPRLVPALAIVLLLRCADSLMIYTEAFTINAGGPGDATRFLALDLGEEIKGFSYGQAAARAGLYFLIVLTIAYAFVLATRDSARRGG